MSYEIETETPPANLSALLTKCEGGCGAVVRSGARFCELCAELNHMYERKRIAAAADRRAHLVRPSGEYARIDIGVASRQGVFSGEDASPILTRWDQVKIGIIFGAVLFGLAAAGFFFLLGAKAAVLWLLRG